MLPVSLPFNLVERRVREGAIGQPLGTSSARMFRTPRSRKKLASGSTISKVVLNPAARRWSDPSFPSPRITASVSPSALTSIFLSTTDLFSPQMQCMSRSLVQAPLCKYASLWIPLPPWVKFDSFAYAEMGLDELRFTCKATATGHQQPLDHTHRSFPSSICLYPAESG